MHVVNIYPILFSYFNIYIYVCVYVCMYVRMHVLYLYIYISCHYHCSLFVCFYHLGHVYLMLLMSDNTSSSCIY